MALQRTNATILTVLLLSTIGYDSFAFVPGGWHNSPGAAVSSRQLGFSFINHSRLLSSIQSTPKPLGPPPQKPGSRQQRTFTPRSGGDGPGRNNNFRDGPGRNNNFRNGPGPNNFRNGPGPNNNIRPGSGPNVLLLQNPLGIKRVIEKPPPRPRRDNNNDDRRPQQNRREGGPPRGGSGGGRDFKSDTRSRPGAPARGGGPGPSGASNDASTIDKGPRRQAKPDKSKTKREYEKKRTPLRVQSGRKSRATNNRRRSSLKKRDRSREKQEKLEKALERKTVVLPEGPMTVGEISELLDEKPASVIKFLMTDMGVMAAISQSLDPATCVAVVEGLGRIIGTDDDDDDDYEDEDEDAVISTGFAMDEDDEEDLVPRPPVVTIMGHVDHGKTSLLDAIRNTKVTATEAGGITQHIAAYQIQHEGSPITFIDTPGHAAFTDMRERGANMTDIVILVVAADDGVKQQTTDSIVCAKQAGVPLIIAVNKCDLETADPTRVKSDLAAYDILTEDLGGDVLCSEISAKTGDNLDDLLTKIMLQSELQDLKANPDRDGQGIVVEARMEKGLGAVAVTLIQRGTIKVGDAFVAGEASGRVRALIADDGKTRLKEAGPSAPVTVVGLNGIPAAGDLLVVAEDETLARELSNARQRIARERASSQYQSGLTQSVLASFSGDNKERRDMCVVVKADVQGSAEALSRSLSELTLENEEAIVGVKVLVAEAGDVTKTDVAIASVTPDTTIIAFNIAATQAAMDDARTMEIPIEYYSVVYDAIDSVESRMQEVLSPTPEGEYVGAAVVQEVFNIGGTGNIAGSRCTDGSIRKGSNVRVMRGDKILTESRVRTLRNFKAEVDAINEGDECGIGLLDYEDFQPGDVIESYVVAKK
eukprot:CAMPEP_0172482876 /NCGR_PEP_ID=MMETSP1066-20121228/9549_1 /TAXON_ID=671091 /ORGANISM="Coscinodiscus wailesii, Strain CCMP2513" /LENGTH=875 /DNA_ID=CAMNT_0013246359 /DNA_START=83 /DNA_END=2710 /DNA_ORIENTATION=+